MWGWFTGWPELTALGAAAVALVVLVLLVAGPAPRVRVALDQAALRVVRGQRQPRMKLHSPPPALAPDRRVIASAPVATAPLTGSERVASRFVCPSTRRCAAMADDPTRSHDPWSIVGA